MLMKINGKNIEKRNVIYAAVFFSIFLFSIFSVLTSAHLGEEEKSINADLITSATILPNQNTKLDLYITDNGEPLSSSQLQLINTKLVHLIGMRNDLKNYFHIHPESFDDGYYIANYTFPSDGVYTLWYEFRHDDKEYIKGFVLTVGDGQILTATDDFNTVKMVEGYKVELNAANKIVAGKNTKLSFEVTDASTNEPVELGTYLDEMAHVIVADKNLKTMIHAHTGEHEEHADKVMLPISGKHAEAGEDEGGLGHLNTVVNFPESGIYKIFVEFNPTATPDGKVVRAEFMVNVEKSEGIKPFYIIFPILFAITVAVTIMIANYGKTGKIFLFPPKSTVESLDEKTESPRVPESESKFRKYLLIIGFILFSVFLVGMIWLATEYNSKASKTDMMFWYVLAYAAGLSMIFLPCTLPLAFVIVPLSMGEKPKKGFIMAVMFGLGLTITITSYGIAMAAIGKVLGFDKATQIMWLIAGGIAFFFGLGELKLLPLKMPGYGGALPEFFQRQGDYIKSFLMGLFLGNAGAGCPNPAFYVLLAYITSIGDIATGASLGFVHGIGRAIPLVFLSIAGILGINATQTIVKHKDKVEKGIGFVLVTTGVFILMLGIYGKAWWENSIVHKVWSEMLSIINPQFGEAAAGTGNAPLTPFYVLFAATVLIIIWYYLDRKFFGESENEAVEDVAPKPDDKTMQEKIFEELKKLEEKETKLEQFEEKEIKELRDIKSKLKKLGGKKK